jgi:hypothetical protein
MMIFIPRQKIFRERKIHVIIDRFSVATKFIEQKIHTVALVGLREYGISVLIRKEILVDQFYFK